MFEQGMRMVSKYKLLPYLKSKLRLLTVHQVSSHNISEFETNMKNALVRENGLVRTVPG